jgi:hypothetical protein
VHDCLFLESKGIPTVVVCNQRFGASGRATARMLGVPEYGLVTLPHLLLALDGDAIDRLAIERLDEILASLVEPLPDG